MELHIKCHSIVCPQCIQITLEPRINRFGKMTKSSRRCEMSREDEKSFMHIKVIIRYVIGLALLSLSGCGVANAKPILVLVAENHASENIENVRAQFGDAICSWGIVGKTFSASYGGFAHPITAEAVVYWKIKGVDY